MPREEFIAREESVFLCKRFVTKRTLQPKTQANDNK
jgi:hypothetical protein